MIGYGAFLGPDEKRDRIRSLYKQGWSPEQLAPLFSITPRAIEALCEDLQHDLELSSRRISSGSRREKA